MKKLFLILLGFSFGTLHAQTLRPTVKWTFNMNSASYGQSCAADLDGDGKLEIVFGCYMGDSMVYVLNAEDGSLLWKYNTGDSIYDDGCNDAAPLIYDVDQDGDLDVVVAASCTPYTFCFDGKTGAVKWKSPSGGSDSPPTAADLYNDGKIKILRGGFGGYVYCLNGDDGKMDWKIFVDSGGHIQTAPTILDIGSDGDLDFVVATYNLLDSSFNKICAYRAKDQKMLWKRPITGRVYHGTAVGDLDGDGKMELLISCQNDTLYCLDAETGNVKWTYTYDYYSFSPVQIGDLDNDGNCDVVTFSAFDVIALKGDGSLLWKYMMPNSGQNFRGAVIADVTNDAYPEVIFGTIGRGEGHLIALNGQNGNQVFDVDLKTQVGKTNFSIDHAPLVADFDGDGRLDVFIAGGYGISSPTKANNYGRAFLLDIGPGNGPDWLMFQRDVHRQSNVCPDNNTGLSPKEKGKNEIVLYPNPANDWLKLKNTYTQPLIYARIFNAAGQMVYSRKLQNGFEDELKLNHLPAGVYNMELQRADKVYHYKKLKMLR